MDNSSLLRAEESFISPGRTSRACLMLMVLISSWTNSCVAMIWPLLVVSSDLRVPFHAAMLFVETFLCLFLGMTSDLRSRKTSVKRSLKIMLGSVLAVLLIVTASLFLEVSFLKLDMLRYSRKYESLDDFNMEALYDNILVLGECTHLMSDLHKDQLEEVLDSHSPNMHSETRSSTVTAFTLLLFTTCCVLQSSSISLYYNLNILAVDSAVRGSGLDSDSDSVSASALTSSYSSSSSTSAGWREICLNSIGSHLSTLVARVAFVFALEFTVGSYTSNSREAVEAGYIRIYCVLLLTLLAMIPLGYHLVEHKLPYNSTFDLDNKKIGQRSTWREYLARVRESVGDKSCIFWFLVIPPWIIYFIQSGNNFHKWIVIDPKASNIEWWELYSLLYESAASLIISILLASISHRFSPEILQTYCFAFLSMVSFGLTLCTYTLYEIPVKTFTDFISAFILCHGIFHLSCLVPSVNALYFAVKFSPPKAKSTTLAIIHSMTLTAPILDQAINNYSSKLVSISGKFLTITTMTLVGIFCTGFFVAKQPSEKSSLLPSFELLPAYNSHIHRAFKQTKHENNAQTLTHAIF